MGDGLSKETLGFLLVLGASFSTTIGSAVVFSKRLIQLANHKVLGGALGLSTGVMLYVSFIEIFVKSTASFEDAGYSSRTSYLYATLCFFTGILTMLAINVVVHWIDKADITHEDLDEDMVREIQITEQNEPLTQLPTENMDAGLQSDFSDLRSGEDRLAISLAMQQNGTRSVGVENEDVNQFVASKEEAEFKERIDRKRAILDKRLKRMGLMTALAIAIHNFPEGLATFVATLDDPAVGASMAVAIAIHNIPEGMCVSIPIYFATKDRMRAFSWGFISGLTEIVGAGIGWLILRDIVGGAVYGFLFGCVAGMMVAICVYELLPTAHRYDPKDQLVSRFVVLGMAILAVSLVAFKY
jgi:zinc transporter, ZIP family